MFQSFNILDWGIFIVMILSVLIGFFWGLVRTFISALIWILSFIISMLAGPTLSGVFGNLVGFGGLALWLTYGSVFIATVVISMIAKIMLRFMLTPNQIGFFDRLGGAGLGLVRGALIVSGFLWFMALAGLSNVQGGVYQGSVLAGFFQPYVNLISTIFPSIEADIQNAGQQVNGQGQQQSSNGNNPDQGNNSGPNPYTMMGPGGSDGGSGMLSSIPGMQSILPWINALWNMMVNQVQRVL